MPQETAFRAAVLAVQAELGASSERVADVLPRDVRELFDAYIMMLGSDSLVADTLAADPRRKLGPRGMAGHHFRACAGL